MSLERIYMYMACGYVKLWNTTNIRLSLAHDNGGCSQGNRIVMWYFDVIWERSIIYYCISLHIKMSMTYFELHVLANSNLWTGVPSMSGNTIHQFFWHFPWWILKLHTEILNNTTLKCHHSQLLVATVFGHETKWNRLTTFSFGLMTFSKFSLILGIFFQTAWPLPHSKTGN